MGLGFTNPDPNPNPNPTKQALHDGEGDMWQVYAEALT